MTRKHPARERSMLSAYIELTKPRILTMVLVTATLGFFMGGVGFHGFAAWDGLLSLLVGVAMTSAGSGALNHYLERTPTPTERTRNRRCPPAKSPRNTRCSWANIWSSAAYCSCSGA